MYFSALLSTNYQELDCIDLKHDLQNFNVFLNSSIIKYYDLDRATMKNSLGQATLTEMHADTREDKLRFWIKVDYVCDEKNVDKFIEMFIENLRDDFNDYLCQAAEVKHIPNFKHHFLDRHFYTVFSEPQDGCYALAITSTAWIYLSEQH